MRLCNVGDRVGAVSHTDGDTIYLFGYGVYEGREVPPKEINFMGAEIAATNPKIRLDTGKVVWGCECWWGPEAYIIEQVRKYKNKVELDVEEERKKTQ